MENQYTERESTCMVLLTAIKLGYETSFDEKTLWDYLQSDIEMQPSDVSSLNEETIKLSRQLMFDNRVEANKIITQIESRHLLKKSCSLVNKAIENMHKVCNQIIIDYQDLPDDEKGGPKGERCKIQTSEIENILSYLSTISSRLKKIDES